MGVSGLKELTDDVIKKICELEQFRKKIKKYSDSESCVAVTEKAKAINKNIESLYLKLKALLNELVNAIENKSCNQVLIDQLITELKGVNSDKGAAQKEIEQYLSE